MEKRLLTVIPLMGIIAITMFLIQEAQIKELRSKIAKQELEMKEKQNMINSYAEKHLKECECNCGWFEDFYYQYADEVGAYE
jgi:ABC-type microcin C transport system permease subunit YejB